MKHKLVIYGNNMYKEVDFDDSFAGSITIGTDKACQIAFRKDRFMTGFIFRIDRQADGEYIISCNDTVYLTKDFNLKEYVRKLETGDHLSLCYDYTGTEVFSIDFLACFDAVGDDYDLQIDCKNISEFSIGGQVECTIRIDDPYTHEDCVKLYKVIDGYDAEFVSNTIGIEVNGFMPRANTCHVRDGEFLSIKGYSFCICDGMIYTTRKAKLITKRKVEIVQYQKNHYEYPKFIKNVRQQFSMPDQTIEVLEPNNKDESEQQNFLMSVMPMLVNMLMMVGLRGMMGGGGMYVIYFAATMSVSTTVTVLNFVKERNKRQEKEERRKKIYLEYLTNREDEIIHLREREKTVAEYMNPSLNNYMTFIENFDNRLFERKREDEDFLKVCLGKGVVRSCCPVDYKKEEYVDTEDTLKDFPKTMHDKYEFIDAMPVCLDLKTANAVGFIGSRTKLYQMEKNLIIGFAASHFYKDIKLFLIMDKVDVPLFSWARWLPITYNEQNKLRNFMYDGESAKSTLEFLYSELSRRESMGGVTEQMQEYVVLVFRSAMLRNHPVAGYIEKAKDLGFHFVFFEEYEEFLNPACTSRIFLEEDFYKGYIQDTDNGDQIQAFEYEYVSRERAEIAAKKLACVYVDEVNLENTLTKNITLFQLLHIMSPYDLDLESRWSNSKIYKTMAAPIGVKSGDEIVYLDLHEKYHGPHGLVAGTTGSGKSEILQTYILSMATLFHPYEVGFIIIDFKGGGMVNQFKDLPHLNGAITNIDGNEIERSLLSIKAELVKRQELFAKLEVNHIDDYIKAYKDGKAKIPLPHLILIVDEFAELKSEQPEFMKELISAARIGRSLGVHLILATQKPSGVVSDQIWSNSKFKLCLKVQNKNDSNEVLKSPLAAEIKEPGRAYLQVGNNEIFQLFQSAYSGVTAKTDGISAQKKFALTSVALSGKRSVIYEQKPNEDDAGETQLKAIVNYVNEFCEKKGISRLPNICLPALPEKLPFTLDGFSYTGTDIVVPVGVVDDPSRQRQYVETWNISQNNFYILGSAQSGKTNLLQTMICGLAMRYSPKDVQMYILDFASMILRNFETLNHVGGVITSTDEQRLKGFLKMMQETVQVRKKYFSQLGLSSYSAYRESGQTELPQIVIFLDNWVAFRGYYPDYEDQIISISRESVAAGISFVVTAGQAGGAGFKLLSNFSKRTALYCNDSSDYGVAFEACRKKLHDIAGRGLIEADKMYYEIQYYLAFAAEKEFEKITLMKAFIDQIHDQYGDMYVPEIPEIPQKVTEAYMAKQFGTSYKSYEIPLGMEFETIGRRTLDLGQTPLLAFVGAKDSSKHQYVEYLLDRALRNQDKAPVDVYLMDDTAGEYRRFESDVSGYTQTTEGAAELLNIAWQKLQKQETPASLQIIVVNSPEIMKQIGTDKAMVDLYRQISMAFKSAKGCFLLTDVENAMISFSAGELLKQVRDTKSFIIFENIKNIKVTDISMGVARTFKKELDVNDAYVIQGDKIERVRVVQKG